MKNTLFAIALATASLAALPAVTHAADGAGGAFVNGNIGRSSLDKGLYDDNDTGYGINAGYRWLLNPNVALGVEGGYTDLGKFDTKGAYSGLGLGHASVKGWTAGVNGRFNVAPQWYVSGRAGLFRADTKGWTNETVSTYVDDSSTKWYAGAGFGYDFSNNLSLGLNYDYYKTSTNRLNLDPSLFSVSAEYRF
ncbi:porin family protein [Rudaea cellulosilytica]|uniref:porin family protein n=1 Tax=Rudaea cellulosilytica TaxID=540746 RepID=UPI000380BC83|nr:porin family protein [Rudaea cellulosilytica]